MPLFLEPSELQHLELVEERAHVTHRLALWILADVFLYCSPQSCCCCSFNVTSLMGLPCSRLADTFLLIASILKARLAAVDLALCLLRPTPVNLPRPNTSAVTLCFRSGANSDGLNRTFCGMLSTACMVDTAQRGSVAEAQVM